MNYDFAHQQHSEWLRKQLEEKRLALVKAESQAVQLRAELAYFEKTLKQITTEIPGKAINTTGSTLDSSASEASIAAKSVARHPLGLRPPKAVLRPEFASRTLGEIAELVLASAQEAISADDMARIIFDTRSHEEHTRARNSLSTELRRGAKEGRWYQIKRGLFAASATVNPSFSTQLMEEYKQAEDRIRKSIAELSKIDSSAKVELESSAE